MQSVSFLNAELALRAAWLIVVVMYWNSWRPRTFSVCEPCYHWLTAMVGCLKTRGITFLLLYR